MCFRDNSNFSITYGILALFYAKFRLKERGVPAFQGAGSGAQNGHMITESGCAAVTGRPVYTKKHDQQQVRINGINQKSTIETPTRPAGCQQIQKPGY
ncbi:hypothetical protein [Massilia psychrophila]|uniref:hypothetical protein n=1 Tax=Massilia psychrophila TaxID=1603353 RepID=UPI00117D58D8|nr:hypothetical protein [Massilia psychrophila]